MKIDRTDRNVSDLLTPFDLPFLDDDDEDDRRARRHEDPAAAKERREKKAQLKELQKKNSPYPPSKLPEELQKTVKVLTDVATLTQAMKAEGIDTDVMPLGR